MLLKNIQEWTLLLLIFGVIAAVGNWVGYSVFPVSALPGMVVLILICLAGLILQHVLPVNIPSVAYIGIIGIIVSMPVMPGSEYVVKWTQDINILALATPILAYAGIAIGRSWTDFVKLGWRSIVVAMFVMVGTFLGSALIAEMVLRMQGLI
ncbi:hypothetical protein [Pseudalkalibacillus hwajinpoensis]|uniref:DUF340 domain-containing protein n=1 Tax=Guptibacillus hwajinpoensis TaxID=208199 RepID=A0A4V5Q1J6_9BACL|nr:hypothetical protein [Pseudalkalibacillus hwajinpoensis]TKD70478.1 hypothetical protein FBF83_07550 [Pseudalkalibacillus hwajinpoensis]